MINDKPPATLHYSTGFPVLIGLRHVQNLASVRVSEPGQHTSIKNKDGETVQNFGLLKGYHHYIIATRPRCMIEKTSFYWDKKTGIGCGWLEFEVGYKKYNRIPFQIFLNKTSPYPFPSLEEDFKDHSDIETALVEESNEGYPNRIAFLTKSGKKYGYYLEPDLFHFIKTDKNHPESMPDFQVEYIGISTGKEGDRDFGDRLRNHEKIIEISGVIQRDCPNRQIYIFGYRAQYSVEVAPGKFIIHSSILENKIGIKAAAEVLEAALIKKFQPKYNIEFKDFLDTSTPVWIPKVKGIIAPSWEQRPAILSTTAFSDNLLNADGSWEFGRFYVPNIISPSNFVCANYLIP